MVERFFVLLICYLFAEIQRKTQVFQRNTVTQGGIRKTSASAWGVQSYPIAITTVYGIFAAAYVNTGSTTRTPVMITDNNSSYKVLITAGASVDGLGYVVFGKA